MEEIQIDDQGRPEPPQESTEADTLRGFLDFQRATLEWKCRGLEDAQLRKALAPSSMTLGGLLKHMARVEDYWFTEVVAEKPTPQMWTTQDWDADPDWEWRTAAEDPGRELRRLWTESVEKSRAVVDSELAGDPDEALGRTHPAWGGQGRVSLRWVLVHMIEEYARHNGHADLLREAIDGQTGE